jgi:hypothetical protein
MIIDKGVSPGEVVTIKLTSGEELIASLVEETDKYIKVSKPRVLAAAQGGIGMAPYLFTVDQDKTIKIAAATVVVLEPTERESAKSYTEATSSLIVL